jgi:photosystem II oxygen-evolving enhancer protein 3
VVGQNPLRGATRWTPGSAGCHAQAARADRGASWLALAFSFVATAAAFSQEASRREVLSAGAAAAGIAFVPAAAQAAAGESPRFSIFGLAGDGTAMSEGAAYGSDQSQPLYSPYSVYGEAGADSLYKESDPSYAAKKKAVLAETRKRLLKLPGYVEKKVWWEVDAELERFMYETRGAAKFLANTKEQKKAANDFFRSIEKADLAAKRKVGSVAAAAAADTVAKLDAFLATL